jgi:hypothetical protein
LRKKDRSVFEKYSHEGVIEYYEQAVDSGKVPSRIPTQNFPTINSSVIVVGSDKKLNLEWSDNW